MKPFEYYRGANISRPETLIIKFIKSVELVNLDTLALEFYTGAALIAKALEYKMARTNSTNRHKMSTPWMCHIDTVSGKPHYHINISIHSIKIDNYLPMMEEKLRNLANFFRDSTPNYALRSFEFDRKGFLLALEALEDERKGRLEMFYTDVENEFGFSEYPSYLKAVIHDSTRCNGEKTDLESRYDMYDILINVATACAKSFGGKS